MKRLLTVMTVMGTLLVGAVPVEAHTLTQGRAQARAQLEAYDFADVGEKYGAVCGARLSAHAVRCIIASYDPEAEIGCDAYVNVRFTSRRSRGTVAGSWYAVVCDGEESSFLRSAKLSQRIPTPFTKRTP